MPWKECHIMDERLRFVARLLEGEKMAGLCAEFGISRKTGYKIYDRYKDCGVHRHRRPARKPCGDSPQSFAARYAVITAYNYRILCGETSDTSMSCRTGPSSIGNRSVLPACSPRYVMTRDG